MWAPLLANLRGYFAEFLDQVSLLRLGILYPPTCVGLRYGLLLVVVAFLGSHSCNTVQHKASPRNSITWLQSRKRPHPLCRCRNINLLTIPYAYRPRVRSRLTPGRKTLPGKPWVYGGRGFHPAYRYSCLHTLLSAVHGRSPFRFNPADNAPLPRQ